jgi:hypothetical protein
MPHVIGPYLEPKMKVKIIGLIAVSFAHVKIVNGISSKFNGEIIRATLLLYNLQQKLISTNVDQAAHIYRLQISVM